MGWANYGGKKEKNTFSKSLAGTSVIVLGKMNHSGGGGGGWLKCAIYTPATLVRKALKCQ